MLIIYYIMKETIIIFIYLFIKFAVPSLYYFLVIESDAIEKGVEVISHRNPHGKRRIPSFSRFVDVGVRLHLLPPPSSRDRPRLLLDSSELVRGVEDCAGSRSSRAGDLWPSQEAREAEAGESAPHLAILQAALCQKL